MAYATNSQAVQLALAFISLAVILPAALYFFHGYLAFRALGTGGTPSTLKGYLRVTFLALFALKNPYTTEPTRETPLDLPGYLSDLPRRRGERPQTRGIAPHRQVAQKAETVLFQKLSQAIGRLSQECDTLVQGTSCFEKHGTGLFSTAPKRPTCSGEICHAHPSDGSMHMTLSTADARMMLDACWGERHPIARGGWLERFVPRGFVMVYAPRNEDEIQTLMRLVRAAKWYVEGCDPTARESNGQDTRTKHPRPDGADSFDPKKEEGVLSLGSLDLPHL